MMNAVQKQAIFLDLMPMANKRLNLELLYAFAVLNERKWNEIF